MEIVNIVASGTLGQEVDLLRLSATCPNVHYDAEMYHGGYLKIGGRSITIYRSGKYIMPGLKSVEELDTLFPMMRNELDHEMDSSLFEEPGIKNIVATSGINSPVDLPKLMMSLQSMDEDVQYEPETFPGLIWRMKVGTANIYSNGRYVILGTKDVDTLRKVNETISERLMDV